jgi:hypothetical protein
MKPKVVVFVAILSLSLSTARLGAGQSGNKSTDTPAHSSKQEKVPPYHRTAPTGPLPSTLNPRQFRQALNRNVYALAAKEKPLLYQLPCYCWCSKTEGHKCLLDCFRDKHASLCAVCKQEAVYAYLQSHKGEKITAIRQGIIDGKWKSVDLTPYGDSHQQPK